MAEIETDREVITIKNVSSVKRDIGLWTLFNLKGGPPFHFPEDLVLQPGESAEVYSAVREEQVPEGAFFWTAEKIWHEFPADVLLVNRVTRLMYWYVHYGDRIDQ